MVPWKSANDLCTTNNISAIKRVHTKWWRILKQKCKTSKKQTFNLVFNFLIIVSRIDRIIIAFEAHNGGNNLQNTIHQSTIVELVFWDLVSFSKVLLYHAKLLDWTELISSFRELGRNLKCIPSIFRSQILESFFILLRYEGFLDQLIGQSNLHNNFLKLAFSRIYARTLVLDRK